MIDKPSSATALRQNSLWLVAGEIGSSEGKRHIVQDGEMLLSRFNV